MCTVCEAQKRTIHIDAIVFRTEATIPVGVTHTWVKVGPNTECDTSAGEKYMRSSPGKGSSLEQCKESCQTTKGCQAFTIFKSGWCSHFSTLCTKTKRRKRGNTYRLSTTYKWNKKAKTQRWSISSDATTTVETAAAVCQFISLFTILLSSQY